ncbi:phage tail length tape measure family protein [Pseudomonas sp.]|uniref:phage tail length tape measure family protein n=1 Tax=Pseudomonas sp. TaxID=306 RepID=UPI002910E2BD|nr:phage tail length tape measure family protein [Pseudomonas sp.]MDU4249001.1 phage tail length tape measure family protein [Pseudomonas sp.]
MANDIASLGIEVKTDSVKAAADDLDRLNQAGAQTEQAATRAGNAWTQAASKMGAAANPASQMAKSFGQSTDAIKAQQRELAVLLGKIDPVVGALGRLDEMEEQLRKHAANGILPKDDFSVYSQKIQAMRNSLGGADDQLERTGNTAKQTAQALRMLPAQFTDIAVGLQSGQSPFTVLLQQGGQIKDQFGGIGPAISAVGRYAMSLVNPFTIAAAAVGALTLAYYHGSEEASAYTKALIATGNAAGTTSGRLADIARQVGDSVGTTGDAAEALTQLAATGKIAEDQLGALARAAVAWESATGKAVSETVAEFARLADDPVKASQELNEQYNYLTAAVFEQIKALEDQGRANDAAKLAEDAYASSLNDRANKVKESLGTLETAWEAVKSAAAGAWDAALNVGREETLEQRIARLKQQLQEVAALGASGPQGRARFQLGLGGGGEGNLRQELAAAEAQQEQEAGQARWAAEMARVNKESIAAQQQISSLRESMLTKAEQREKAIADYWKNVNAVRAANPFTNLFSQAQIDKDLAGIDAKFADREKKTRTASAKAYTDDAATRMLQSLREQGALLDAQLSGNDKLSAAKREQVKFEQLIADLKSKDILTADQKSLLANQDAISAQLEKNSQLDAEITKRKELLKLQSFKGGLDQTLQSDAQGYEESRAGEGLGKLQRQELRDRLRIQRDYQRQVFQLQTQQGSISTDLMDKETKALEDNLNKRLKLNEDHYDQLAQDQESFSKGAKDAFSEYLDNARDIAGATKNLVGDAMQGFTKGVSDSIGQAIVQGDDLRESLSNVAQTIETQLISALIQLGVQYAVNASIGQSVGAAATAASATMAAATAVAWAPAAALASLASFGGNAAPAAVALTGTATLAESIAAASALGGFYTGGFTGSGNPFDVAGVVHKGEYVMTADTVNRLGVDNLDAIQKGRAISSAVPAANDSSAAAPGQRRLSSSGNTYHITVNQPNVTNATEARKSSMAARREIGMLVQGTGRAM